LLSSGVVAVSWMTNGDSAAVSEEPGVAARRLIENSSSLAAGPFVERHDVYSATVTVARETTSA
jgi:hypothetical protein